MYAETDDVRGGMGLAGAAEFQKFVDDGGVLMTFGVASYFPAEFGIAKGVDAQNAATGLLRAGPVREQRDPDPDPSDDVRLRAEDAAGSLRRRSAAAGGSAGRASNSSPASSPDRPQVVARFTGGDAGVLSGLMRSPDQMRNRPMVVDAPSGKGRVLLFANNPIYRWQTFGEHGMVFNALLFWNDMPAGGARPAQSPTATAGQQ